MASPNTTTYPLEGDDLARVITLCASHGLAIHAATRRGVLLELEPHGLDGPRGLVPRRLPHGRRADDRNAKRGARGRGVA